MEFVQVLWLQTQGLTIRTRHISECDSRLPVLVKSANGHRVEPPPRDPELNIWNRGHSNCGHVCHSPQHASSPVYVSNSVASSTGDRCSVTRLVGEVDVHVSTVSLAQQSHSETKDHPGGLGNSNSPLVAITTVVPTSYSSVCRPPHIVRYRQDLLSQQGYVSDGKSSDHKLAAPAKLQRFRLSQTISDMIKLTSMELQRPGITPVLSQWDLG